MPYTYLIRPHHVNRLFQQNYPKYWTKTIRYEQLKFVILTLNSTIRQFLHGVKIDAKDSGQCFPQPTPGAQKKAEQHVTIRRIEA